ncbi:MAG: CHASE2 domain-containing protein, partial [Cyanobacteria bacterium P01_A01_bin.105]
MKQLSSRRGGLLSGLSILGVITAIRLLGFLQGLEWKVLDWSLRVRPAEPVSDRITLVTITEADIQASGEYPMSDATLAQTLKQIQAYNPRAIGLDIFRDLAVGEGQAELAEVFSQFDNLVVANKMLPPVVQGPTDLPEEQVGFVDALVDEDGSIRRSLLGAGDLDGQYRLSFTVMIARQYLAPEKIILENGHRDPETMRFREAEIPQFRTNLGGYVRADARGNQTLINFRAGQAPFEQITYQALMNNNVDPDLLTDRVVLVGYNAVSAKDVVTVAALPGVNPSLVPGVDVQAHAISQLLSATLDGRSFLRALPVLAEYGLLLASGLAGLLLARHKLRPSLHFLTVASSSSGLFLLFCSPIVVGWWLPTVPVVGAFLMNAVVLYPMYQMQTRLSFAVQQRQQLIDQTFDTIHNGPLHTLSRLLSEWPDNTDTPGFDKEALENLNRELRDVYETMQTELLLPKEQIVLNHQSVSLEMPLGELLYEVYQNTIQREQPFFEKMLLIPDFKEMTDVRLSSARKGELGRFLEEILLNVSKYAVGATRVKISCLLEHGENVIRVVDNGVKGLPTTTPHEGHGTRHARQLARKLGGTFNRQPVLPKGVLCELRWPATVARWPLRWPSGGSDGDDLRPRG